MKEKDQDFRELSAFLNGNKAEYPGKLLQLTSDFPLETPITHWVYGPGKDPALRTKKNKCEVKSLEVTSSLWKVEEESMCFGTVSETRRTQR